MNHLQIQLLVYKKIQLHDSKTYNPPKTENWQANAKSQKNYSRENCVLTDYSAWNRNIN